MCLRERQCVFGKDNVSSGQTMCLRDRQCLSRRDNVFLGETMCLPETQCGFQRHNVVSGDTMWLLETQCDFQRQDVCLSDTYQVFPGHKLTSRSSPDLFPASIRIKTIREIRWSCQHSPECRKKYENQPSICFHFFFKEIFWRLIFMIFHVFRTFLIRPVNFSHHFNSD